MNIHRLHLARVNLDGRFNPPTYQDTRIDVFAYLIVNGAQVTLVDTGVGTGNEYVDKKFTPDRTPIADALARFDIVPADVTTVVNSHLHFDHCGNNALFEHAEFFIQERELEVARTTVYTIKEWFDFPNARIHPVAGDMQIAPDIELIATPGHTPGHQSVLVQSQDGLVVIAAQAAFTCHEYERGGDPAEQAHEGLDSHYLESIAALKRIDATRVLFSHDTAQPRV